MANSALGKNRPSLPSTISKADGSMTSGNAEAATVMSDYYISKVDLLRERNVGCVPPPTDWPKKSKEFSFTFVKSSKISKTISGLGNTEAIGTDGVPTSVYGKGVRLLSDPIKHLVNMSLAAGKVPVALKTGIIHPVYKGHGKNRADPASYRPASILCALSKDRLLYTPPSPRDRTRSRMPSPA